MIIRIAASEIYLKAEKANLADQVQRLRKARDTLVAQSAASRAELERIQVIHTHTLSRSFLLLFLRTLASSPLQCRAADVMSAHPCVFCFSMLISTATSSLFTQADLAQRETDVSLAYTSHMQQKQQLSQKTQALNQVQTSVAHSKAEIAQLMSDIEKAKSEKQDALKLKEEAIMRAVQFGVQGENRTSPFPQLIPPFSLIITSFSWACARE